MAIAVAASWSAARGPAAAEPAAVDDPAAIEAAPGLLVEQVRGWVEPAAAVGDRLITLVRIDPEQYDFRLLTAAEHGQRTAPDWVEDFDLTGVINASMFRSDLTSTGLMVDGDKVHSRRVNGAFGAFFAFGPRRDGLPAVSLYGRGCPGFDLDAIRSGYRVVVQNYRMLDCQGKGLAWKDPKGYSVAAVGVDRKRRVVFIHSRTPYRVRDLNAMLAAPRLGITAAMFVEGGPEASLYVKTERHTVRGIGSFESGFFLDDSNALFWPIPNVIGFAPRTRTAAP